MSDTLVKNNEAKVTKVLDNAKATGIKLGAREAIMAEYKRTRCSVARVRRMIASYQNAEDRVAMLLKFRDVK